MLANRKKLLRKEQRRPESSFGHRTSGLSRPDVKLTTDRPGVSPDGRQPEAVQGAVEPRSGTIGEDESRREPSP